MKSLIIATGLLLALVSYGQIPEDGASMEQSVQKQADEIFESLVKIRRDFHKNPELPGQEQQTAQKIEQYLKSLGLEVRTNVGGYGVVGILKGGNGNRKIAWRADIDAMSIDYQDNLGFRSTRPGVSHICGHDVHAAIGLGIANVLSKHRDRLDGTIYFVFQPSEENYRGAKAMIDDGLFRIISPQEIYGLHVNPMPTGLVTAKPGLVYAYLKLLSVTYRKTAENDAIIEFTKKLMAEIQDVSPDGKFPDTQNIGDPEAGIASRNTIYLDYLTVDRNFTIDSTGSSLNITALINGTDKGKLDSIPLLLKQKIISSQYSEDFVSIKYSFEYPTVINDISLTKESSNRLTESFGNQVLVPYYGVIPLMNDDFAYFQQEIPGVYFFLGGSNYQEGKISMPHSPAFAVDEECIRVGVKYFSSMLAHRLDFK